MKLAFSSLGCPDYSFEQIVRAAVEYGYQGVSIRTVQGTTDLLSLPEFSTGLQATRSLLGDNGVVLLCVSTGVRFTSPKEAERSAQLDGAKRLIDLAAELASPYVRIFGGPVTAELDREATMANIADGFYRAAEHAKTQGVTVLLETHDTFATGKAARALVDRINHPSVGLIWDILHSLRSGESFEETVGLISADIHNVHLKDSADFDANHFDIKLCGEGKVPIAKALRLLDSVGYNGYYEFEWEKGWHPEIPTADVAFPHFVRYISELRRNIDG